MVKFDPQNELILFVGQIKRNNNEWIDFCELSHDMIINLDEIKEILEKTCNILKKRYDAYIELSDGFSLLKNIEIIEE